MTDSPTATRTLSVLVPMIVEKCLASTRSGTRQLALDLLLMYVEIENADPVLVLLK